MGQAWQRRGEPASGAVGAALRRGVAEFYDNLATFTFPRAIHTVRCTDSHVARPVEPGWRFRWCGAGSGGYPMTACRLGCAAADNLLSLLPLIHLLGGPPN